MSVTVGLLYPGELGSGVAQLLRARGVRVVTTLEGRSAATAERARAADVTARASLDQLVAEAGVVISLVPPDAAADLAAAYRRRAHLAPAGAIYVDMNSISPERACGLAADVEAGGTSFVDAAINGLAKNLTSGATLFLSGARAPEVAALFGTGLRVQVVGAEPGRASAMKMVLSGLSKGLCALFVELAAAAHQRAMLAELLEAASTIYPGIAAVIERMLPTYRIHAARRASEMRELEATVRWSGLDPVVIAGIRHVHERLAEIPFDAERSGFLPLLEQIAEELLPAPKPRAG